MRENMGEREKKSSFNEERKGRRGRERQEDKQGRKRGVEECGEEDCGITRTT